MRFGSWIPLDTLSPEQVGATPGVFQLRLATGLLSYPGGQSAMVAYGAGDDLAAALGAFLGSPAGSRARALGPLWIRIGAPDRSERPQQVLTRLYERFAQRFGSLPAAQAGEP